MGLAFIILAALGGTAFVYREKLTSSGIPKSLTTREYSGSVKASRNVDKGLSPNEKIALDWALAHERDGARLRDFGQVMLPDFPIASSILLAKSGGIIYRGRPVGKLSPNGPTTKAASAAVLTKTQATIQAGQTFRGIAAHGDSEFGNIFDLDNYTDAVSNTANAVVDVVHYVPGVDELGEQLKDFAHTGFGEWALRIMSTYGYYVMAPYLGAQMASISFALPGVLKADPFMESWLKETIDRVIKTAQILLANQVKFPDLGNATNEAMNKFLANNPAVRAMVEQATKQIGTATELLKERLGPEIAAKIQAGAQDAIESAARKLAAEYGMPPDFAKMAREAGIQEINAAAAYDLIAHTNYQGSLSWDAATGVDILAHMKQQRFGSVQNARMSSSAMQSTIDAMNREYRAKRPMVVAYYVARAGNP